jgi:translation initiation factor 2 alpha subunit (eIF-2alpha)
MIKEGDGSVTLDFDLFVWKAINRDAVFVLRDIFNHISELYIEKGIDLRYLGAPSYQLSFTQIEIKSIDNHLENIRQIILNFMKDNNVIGYDIKFDTTKKKVKRGDITISFPYKIDMF